MTLKSSLLFAKSLIFPKTEKKSSARRSVFGAFICIGLSIIPLIVVLCITNGMINGMTQRLIGLSTGNIQAYVAGKIKETSSVQDFYEFSELIKSQNEIINAVPEVKITALGTNNDYRTGLQIRGVDSKIFLENQSFKNLFEVIEGENLELRENDAIIGKKLSELLNIHVGDVFRVITTKFVNGKVVPKLTPLKVKAVISSGYQEMDAFWTFVSIQKAYSSLSLTNATYTVMIEAKDAFSPQLALIKKKLQSNYGRIANFYSWNQVHQSEYESFSSTKVMLILIMSLIVLVASINICSAIVILVMERRKEIAILKSLGASSRGITLSFLITGLACGTGGVLFGLPIGLLLSVNANEIVKIIENLLNKIVKIGYFINGDSIQEISQIHLMDPAYYIQVIPIDIPFSQIFIICCATIFLSLIVSIIPSIKAGKEKPLDILRKN